MITNKETLREYIKADRERYTNIHGNLRAKLSLNEDYRLFKYVKNMRYVEYYKNKSNKLYKIIYLLYYMRHRYLSNKLHISIAPNSCGPGLYLLHPGFRRLGCYLKIGKNCTFLPNVLIGKKSPNVIIKNDYIIGDNCYFGYGSIIMGPVKIGNNVTIGAGCVVTKDIPDNAVVVGNPSKIIKFKTI